MGQSSSLTVFQSRNRDTFRFKGTESVTLTFTIVVFQSRNRDTFRFKSNTPLLTDMRVSVSIS